MDKTRTSPPKLSRVSPLWTVQEVANYLNVRPRSVYRLVRDKGLPGKRIGREYRFRRADVEAWFETGIPAVPMTGTAGMVVRTRAMKIEPHDW
jgi:excisionase family DNA binding protein